MQKLVQDWNIEDLKSLIENGVQESLTLDYKRSAALARTNKERNELIKDVSVYICYSNASDNKHGTTPSFR